jgi:hypothetical protein
MKTRKPYPYVHEIIDRHGRRRAYLRKLGCPSVPLPLPIGSRAFLEAYHAGLESTPAPAGTVAALVSLYKTSRLWTVLSPQSQRTYSHILDHLVADHGHRLVKQMEPKHVEVILTAKASTPTAANKLRKLLLLLMRVAILNGETILSLPSRASKSSQRGIAPGPTTKSLLLRHAIQLGPRRVLLLHSCSTLARDAAT